MPLVQDGLVQWHRGIVIDEGVVGCLTIPAVAANPHEVDAVRPGRRQGVDEFHLVTVARAVGPQIAAIEEPFRVARTAHEERLSVGVPKPQRGLSHRSVRRGHTGCGSKQREGLVLLLRSVDGGVIPADDHVEAGEYYHGARPTVAEGAESVPWSVGPVTSTVAVHPVDPPEPAVASQVVALVVWDLQ